MVYMPQQQVNSRATGVSRFTLSRSFSSLSVEASDVLEWSREVAVSTWALELSSIVSMMFSSSVVRL